MWVKTLCISKKRFEQIPNQTKSLTSSAAGESLWCRFSFPAETKQAMLPLLFGIDEFRSEGVEPPNRREDERPRCLFPASMLAVFICWSCPYNLRISSWKTENVKALLLHGYNSTRAVIRCFLVITERVSAEQCHRTVWRAQCTTHGGDVFLKLSADQLLVIIDRELRSIMKRPYNTPFADHLGEKDIHFREV